MLDHYIGSTNARLVALLLSVITIATIIAYYLAWLDHLAIPIIVALITLLALIHISRTIYQAWMRGAKKLGTVVSIFIFGLIYFLIVPFFTLLARRSDPLQLRTKQDSSPSFWIQRRERHVDSDSFDRMG